MLRNLTGLYKWVTSKVTAFKFDGVAKCGNNGSKCPTRAYEFGKSSENPRTIPAEILSHCWCVWIVCRYMGERALMAA